MLLTPRGTIIVNGRCLLAPLTGVQRYAHEVSRRLSPDIVIRSPANSASGIRGQLWEQVALPCSLSDRDLLWSPGNTGPLAVQRQVVTIHDISPIEHPEWFSRSFSSWYRWMWPRLMRTVRHVIADSHYTRDRILSLGHLREERISVVHLGVDRRFTPDDPAPRHDFMLPCRRYALALGSLEPRKNLGLLITAWDLVAKRIPDDIWLVIAGAGNPRVFTDCGLPAPPPRVHFAGRIADEHLPSLYRDAMAFLYPSLYEGFGLPPLEAMASGVPVLTGNRTSLPEAVGDAALVIDPTDVHAIADGISRLLVDQDLRLRLRTSGLERAERFTWNRTAAETWSILSSVLVE